MILPEGGLRPAIPEALLSRVSEILELEAGKRFRIQAQMPDLQDVLDVTVPAGKHWSIGVVISVVETDA